MTRDVTPSVRTRARGGRNHLTRRLLLLITCGLLAAGLVWGLGSAVAADPSASPASGKVTLRLGWTNDPDNLNPFVGYESSSYEVWALNYDMLIGYGTDGSPKPQLAESWTVSDDGLVWTFKIRQGVNWQDGEPLTAKDVAFSYNVIIDQNLTAYSTYTNGIKEARVVDDYTVEMICDKPKANMERLWIYVIPEHIWGKAKDLEKMATALPIIGSGPFQAVEWKKGQFVRMEKNPNYWGKAPVIDEILFETYTNSDTMTQDLKAGSLDGAYDIPSAQFNAFKGMAGFDPISYNLFMYEYLSFNCYEAPSSLGNPVLRDPKFRLALAWAVDREKCATIAWNGLARVGTTAIPPDEYPANFDAHYEPTAEEMQGFDIEKSKQMLDAAGYTDGNGDGIREYKGKPIKLTLYSRAESLSSQSQGKLIAGWFKEIGLDIDYRVIDDGALSDKLYNYDADCNYAPDYDIYLWDFFGYADPGDSLVNFTTDQIEWWNDPCWSNAEYDKLAVQQYSEMDVPTRLDLLKRMQQIMYNEVPEVVLDYPPSLEVVNTSRWDGWTPFMDGGVFYTNYNIDSYLNLKPKVAEEASSGSSTNLIIVIVALVVVAAVVVWLLVRRRGSATVEE